MKKAKICMWCINGFRSHGEPVCVGEQASSDTEMCELCQEEGEELYECILD